MKIILGCKENDELLNLCEDFFGSENIEVLKRNGILNLDEVAIIISIANLTIATITFLYSVLADWKSELNPDSTDEEKNKDDTNHINNSVRRVLVTKEGDINLEGYTAKEVERILKLLEESHNDQ